MKLDHNRLHAHLQNGLLPVYIISGDETLLCQEALQAISDKAKSAGFLSRETYFIEGRFNWDEVLLSANSLSLFSDKKFILLRFSQGKFSEADNKALALLSANLSPDVLFVLYLPKLDASTSKGKIFQLLDNAGASITIWPIERKNLPFFIKQRLNKHGLQASDEAIAFLADNTEGNLLATAQEIEKLALLCENTQIDLTTMMDLVSSASRYNTFTFADHLLAGDATSALITLKGLEQEGHEPILVLWNIHRELRTLYRLFRALQSGLALEQAIRNERVLAVRQSLFKTACSRLNLAKIESALLLAMQIDHSIKGLEKHSAWQLLEQLSLNLCQKKTHP